MGMRQESRNRGRKKATLKETRDGKRVHRWRVCGEKMNSYLLSGLRYASLFELGSG